MTKKYIAFTDNVLPVRKPYSSGDEGKIAKVVLDGGEYVLKVTEAGSSSVGWSDVTSKPFSTIGTGLTVVSDALTANTQFKFQIFQTLPTASAEYAQTVALILKSTTEAGNEYDEYACVNTSGSTWSWERIGNTSFTLNIEQTTAGISINGTSLQSADATHKGLLTASDYNTFAAKEPAISKNTAFNKNFGNAAGTVCEGNDSRLSDARTPTAHASSHSSSGSDAITIAESQVMNLTTDLASKAPKDAGTTVTFAVGCDATGPYFEY